MLIKRDDMKHASVTSYASLKVRVGPILRVFQVQEAFTITGFSSDPYYRMTIAQTHQNGNTHHYKHIDTVMYDELHNEIPQVQIEPKRQDELCIVVNIDIIQDSHPDSFDYSFELGPAKLPSPTLGNFQQYPTCIHCSYDMNDDLALPVVGPILGHNIQCILTLRPKHRIVDATKIIQRRWREIYYDPTRKVGHRQLKSSLKTMLQPDQSRNQSRSTAIIDQVVGFTRINDNKWQHYDYTDQHTVDLVMSQEYTLCRRFYFVVITLKSNKI